MKHIHTFKGYLGEARNLQPNPGVSREEYIEDIKMWSAKAEEFENLKRSFESRIKRSKNPAHIDMLEGEIEVVQDQINTFREMVSDLETVLKKIK